MMSYINETDFVIENKELVYPEIVTDGLQLYYDAKGKRDTDYHRDTMLDMSGNKNHGKLHNFAYEKHSGYKDGLVFDYIDDKLVRPKLNLKPDDFTFMLNGNIISFSPDGTVKRVQDGEVIESKGFNLIRNGDFADDTYRWNMPYTTDTFQTIKGLAIIKAGNRYGGILQNLHSPSKMPSTGEKYYFCANVERASSGIQLYLNDGRGQTQADGPSIGFVSNTRILSDNPTALIIKLQDNNTSEWTESKISNMVVINLTEVFGTGNEPTKEQVDEIINRFGFIPNTQDLIDRIEYKGNDLGDMENIIDGLYKTEVLSGQELYTDKADDSVVHVEIDGKSYQPNCITNLFTEKTVSGNTYAVTTGVSIEIIQGHQYYTRRTFTSDSRVGSFGSIRMLGTNTHLFTSNSQSGDFSEITEYTGKTRTGQVMFYGSSGNPSGGTIEDTFIIDLTSHFGAGNEPSTNEMDKITDALGWFSGSKEYPEEISGLKTIPTPEYPIEIHSLNDFDVVSSVGRENLLKDSKREWKAAREYVAPSYNLNEIFDKYPIGQTYTISFDAKSDDPSKNSSLQFYSNPGTTPQNKYVFATRHFTGLTTEYQRFSHTITPYLSADPSFPKSGMSFYGQYDTGNIPTIRNIKIELGTTATPYYPAPQDITENDNHPLIDKINLLLDEPLRSVGDVKDRLFRDSDGIWKVERRVWEDLIDGSKILKYPSYPVEGYTKFYYTHLTKSYMQPRSDVMTNLLPSLETNLGYSNNGQIGVSTYSSGTGNIIYGTIETSRLASDDAAGLVAYFKANPLTVYYQLANPIIETLSQSLQDKLNNLRSFEDSNYVYTVLQNENNYLSENLKPTLHAKFLYNNWYKEDRVINNLMIYNRALTNEEMLQNYKTIKRRWGM